MRPESEREIDRLQDQFNDFNETCKELTLDKLSETPKKDVEEQTKLSQKELERAPGIYLKPKRSIASQERFNEKFREDYEFDKEYVHFIAENHEVIGETIDIWTKPYPGIPAQEWEVPVNKPVWGPRFLAEQIARKKYHHLEMKEEQSQQNYTGSGIASSQFYGKIVADVEVPRLTARPVSTKKSIFMGQ